ncbi:MAG: Xylose isomerase [Planctomycetaceae bacterium]|nr:Xylose isomerase [Planctomycetaceae bacterium]
MSDFIYTLNSSTIRPTPILEKIRIAGEVGYKAIELWHDDLDAHVARGGTLSEVRQALADQGLTVPTTIYLKGWFETTGELHRQELVECQRRMQQAVEVGALHVIAGPAAGFADHDQGAKNYYELLELGRQIGVKPAMEFLGFVEDLNTIEGALEIITKSNHPDGTIVLDPFHIFRGGGSAESIALLKSEQIAICHFNDTPASPPRLQQHDKDRVYPGDGHLDLKRMLNLLRQIGYNRWLSLELFREDLWASDPREVARVGLEKMQAVVEG